MVTQLRDQAKALAPFLFVLYLFPLFFIILLIAASLITGESILLFTRDPASVADIHPLIGVASNIGILIWTIGAGICLFGSALLFRQPGETTFSLFLLFWGLMTLLLIFDDFFLFHDWIFPRYFDIIRERYTFFGYGIIMLIGMLIFWKTILKTEYLILFTAFVFFALSYVSDEVQHRLMSMFGEWFILFEDGLKLFGIMGWSGYCFRTCYLKIRSHMVAEESVSNTAESYEGLEFAPMVGERSGAMGPK